MDRPFIIIKTLLFQEKGIRIQYYVKVWTKGFDHSDTLLRELCLNVVGINVPKKK